MYFTIREIIAITGAKVLKSNCEDDLKYSFSTDSRNINSSQIYIPLKGEKFNGEDFIKDVVEKGVKGYFTTDELKIFDNIENIFFVEDTKIAYLKLAREYKRRINPITIAITGSSGKTTTKEMMYAIASEKYKTKKSILNHNNEIGLCQTLFSLEEDTEVLIVEMDMRGFNEISLLSEYTEPDIALIANVGTAHIGRLGSVENIAKAKCEITNYLKPDGILIAHDNSYIKSAVDKKCKVQYFGLNDKELSIQKMEADSCSFIYKGQLYELMVSGEHNIQNAIGAIDVALYIGMKSADIANGLKKFKPIEKRWEFQKIYNLNIINDSYNANPDSVKAALKTFLTYTPSPKSVVLGDMGELGENSSQYHKEIGIFLDNFDCDYVLTFGDLSEEIVSKTHKCVNFKNKLELADYMINNFPVNSNVLLKASRSMKFEEIIEELRKK